MTDVNDYGPAGFEPVDATDMREAVASFNEATKPDAPTIRKPSPGNVTLFYGLRDGDDVHRDAEVRELNGSDEEAISKLDARKAGTFFFIQVEDLVLRRAVKRIGGIDVAAKPEVLGDLLIGDRGLLFTEVLIATYGEEKTYEGVICPSCQEHNDLIIDIRGMLEVKPLQSESPTAEVTLKGGRTVFFRYPTGSDQIQVYQTKKDATDAELNTFMIARCVTSEVGDKVAFAQRLSIPDRRKIVKALSAAPSVAFKEVSVPCTSCNEIIPFAFGWADLLFGE